MILRIALWLLLGCVVAVAQPTPPGPGAVAPSSAAAVGIVPGIAGSASSSVVLKASAGNLYSVYATNSTATAGFLIVLNATSDPTSGTVTPLACVPLPASGAASVNYIPTPSGLYSVGITAVLSSASTCFSITEGTITGFIAGTVQ